MLSDGSTYNYALPSADEVVDEQCYIGRVVSLSLYLYSGMY
jgi:hypothetical protein